MNPGDSLQLLERSNGLVTWRGLTMIEEMPSSEQIALSTDRQAFYRLFEQAEAITADVITSQAWPPAAPSLSTSEAQKPGASSKRIGGRFWTKKAIFLTDAFLAIAMSMSSPLSDLDPLP